MAYNNLNAAAAEAAQRKKEKDDLKRGKTKPQQECIDFFFGADGGCFSKKTISADEYVNRVNGRLKAVNTYRMALNKLGIDEEEVQEIAPVSFQGYVINNKFDNYTRRISSNQWVSSDYQVTWLFFGERELFIYQYSFSMLSDSKRESTMQYFYQDVTNFAQSSEVYQKWQAEEQGGCSSKVVYQTVSAESNEFKIIVPGDTLRCPLTPSDKTDAAIRGMRNKLREIKNQ